MSPKYSSRRVALTIASALIGVMTLSACGSTPASVTGESAQQIARLAYTNAMAASYMQTNQSATQGIWYPNAYREVIVVGPHRSFDVTRTITGGATEDLRFNGTNAFVKYNAAFAALYDHSNSQTSTAAQSSAVMAATTGKWIKMPGGTSSTVFQDMAAASRAGATTLIYLAKPYSSELSKSAATTLNGQRVIKLSTSTGQIIFVTTRAPVRPLQFESTLKGATTTIDFSWPNQASTGTPSPAFTACSITPKSEAIAVYNIFGPSCHW